MFAENRQFQIDLKEKALVSPGKSMKLTELFQC